MDINVCLLYYYIVNDLSCLPTVIEEKNFPTSLFYSAYFSFSFCRYSSVRSTLSLSLSLSRLFSMMLTVWTHTMHPNCRRSIQNSAPSILFFIVVLMCYQQYDIQKKNEVRSAMIDKKFQTLRSHSIEMKGIYISFFFFVTLINKERSHRCVFVQTTTTTTD